MTVGVLAAIPVIALASPAQATTVSVTTASELKAALKAAAPGDTITLADGEYRGKFVGANDGSAAAPIAVVGPRGAVLTTGSTSSGYALNLTGDHWNLAGFTVATAKKGIVLDGSIGSRLDSLDVGSIGEEAVHVRHQLGIGHGLGLRARSVERRGHRQQRHLGNKQLRRLVG